MNCIYISNLEETTAKTEILDHFSKYGFIIDCYMSKFKNGKCKGYAKLTLKTKESYEKILQEDHHFGGRKAKVEPYVQEAKEAKMKDRDIVERRVCILAIPKGMEDTMLKKAFEAFGEVEKAYVREGKDGGKNHGFVTFVEKRSCKRALIKRFMDIEGWGRLQIREFKSKALERMKNKEKNSEKQVPSRFRITKKEKVQHSTTSHNSEENKQDQNFNCRFMNPQKLQSYLKKIRERNPNLNAFGEKFISDLELFSFNKEQRDNPDHQFKNYNWIANKFSGKVQKNHSNNNIRFGSQRNDYQKLNFQSIRRF